MTEAQALKMEFRFSNGWLFNFCYRYRISNQMKTEKKKYTVAERLPDLFNYHHDFLGLLKGLSQVCAVYGAFPLANRWNADHIPLVYDDYPYHYNTIYL